ncbi:asparaginase [Nesterenkonia sp. E16_7]|uniref:asparaginase n=1 Tax=unclassified Nesterenkonia TaxID=2629769 RepID=UPI001A938882|nr:MULTISPECIES: asparaginase [unclassified Nesterenkonia]MBO0594947.1 asparaginase [Nesterenkonia sp. E16_10]MBO0598602.1 asparaginase [Nesterenkonia sp. E16_7]
MTRIVVLATGGTISSRPSSEGGSRAKDSAADLIRGLELHGLDDFGVDADGAGVSLESEDIAVQNSFNFSFADLSRIAHAVARILRRADVDGVVVTHGTDTMEETLALLGFTHDDPRPVVFTGAQRSPDQFDSDGPRNLHDAIRTAASPASRGQGVLLVFGGEIHSALGLRKNHTLAPQPFVHRSAGSLGVVLGSGPRYFAQALTPDPLPLPNESFDTQRVDLVLGYPGADAALMHAALEAGATGVIVLGAGAGNPGVQLTDAIAQATAQGVLVGLGTRTGTGPVAVIYGGGGAVDAVAAGAVPLSDLPATQARILMALLLSTHAPSLAKEKLQARLGDHN